MMLRPPVLPSNTTTPSAHNKKKIGTSSVSSNSSVSSITVSGTSSSSVSGSTTNHRHHHHHQHGNGSYYYQQQFPAYQPHRVSAIPLAPKLPSSDATSKDIPSIYSQEMQTQYSGQPHHYPQQHGVHNHYYGHQQTSHQSRVMNSSSNQSVGGGSTNGSGNGSVVDDLPSIYSGLNSTMKSPERKSVRFQDVDIFLSEAREKARQGRQLPGRSKTKQRLNLPDYDQLVSVYQQADPSFLTQPIQYLPNCPYYEDEDEDDAYADVEDEKVGDEEEDTDNENYLDENEDGEAVDIALVHKDNVDTYAYSSPAPLPSSPLKGKAKLQAFVANKKAAAAAMTASNSTGTYQSKPSHGTSRDSMSSGTTCSGGSLSSSSVDVNNQMNVDNTGGNMFSRAKALVRRVSSGSIKLSPRQSMEELNSGSAPSKRMIPVRVGSNSSINIASAEDEKEDDVIMVANGQTVRCNRSSVDEDGEEKCSEDMSYTMQRRGSSAKKLIIPVRSGIDCPSTTMNQSEMSNTDSPSGTAIIPGLTSSSSWSSASSSPPMNSPLGMSSPSFTSSLTSSSNGSSIALHQQNRPLPPIPPAKPPKPCLSKLVPVDSCDQINLNRSQPRDEYAIGGDYSSGNSSGYGSEYDSAFPQSNNSPSVAAAAIASIDHRRRSRQGMGIQQYVPYPLSEEDAICLMMLVSEQEEKYGVNMFEVMSKEDQEQALMLSSIGGGTMKYEDAVLKIFEMKFGITHEQPQQPGSSRDNPINMVDSDSLDNTLLSNRSNTSTSSMPRYPPPPIPVRLSVVTDPQQQLPTTSSTTSSLSSHGSNASRNSSSVGSANKPPTPQHRRNSAGIPPLNMMMASEDYNNNNVPGVNNNASNATASSQIPENFDYVATTSASVNGGFSRESGYTSSEGSGILRATQQQQMAPIALNNNNTQATRMNVVNVPIPPPIYIPVVTNTGSTSASSTPTSVATAGYYSNGSVQNMDNISMMATAATPSPVAISTPNTHILRRTGSNNQVIVVQSTTGTPTTAAAMFSQTLRDQELAMQAQQQQKQQQQQQQQFQQQLQQQQQQQQPQQQYAYIISNGMQVPITLNASPIVTPTNHAVMQMQQQQQQHQQQIRMQSPRIAIVSSQQQSQQVLSMSQQGQMIAQLTPVVQPQQQVQGNQVQRVYIQQLPQQQQPTLQRHPSQQQVIYQQQLSRNTHPYVIQQQQQQQQQHYQYNNTNNTNAIYYQG